MGSSKMDVSGVHNAPFTREKNEASSMDPSSLIPNLRPVSCLSCCTCGSVIMTTVFAVCELHLSEDTVVNWFSIFRNQCQQYLDGMEKLDSDESVDVEMEQLNALVE